MTTILDIRTKKEYCSGHICGAQNIVTPSPPFSKNIFNKLFNNLQSLHIQPDTTIYVYCKKGIRAEEARKILLHLGMKNVINIGGVQENPLKKMIKDGKVKLCKCN